MGKKKKVNPKKASWYADVAYKHLGDRNIKKRISEIKSEQAHVRKLIRLYERRKVLHEQICNNQCAVLDATIEGLQELMDEYAIKLEKLQRC